MPLLPYRTRIRQAVLVRLSTITAGALYWSTPSLVTDGLLAIDQYDGTSGGPNYLATGPVLGVLRAPGSELALTSHDQIDYDSADALAAGYSGTFRLAVAGYVLAGPGQAAADLLERVQQDTEVCLLQDPTLDGLVTRVRPDGPDDNDGGAMEPLAFFVQDWVARKL